MNKNPDLVPEEDPLIILDSKSAVCTTNNDKDTKHTRHISKRVHFVSNDKICKMHKIEWCEVVLQLVGIAIKTFGGNALNLIMKYVMVGLDNWDITLVQEG